jgi:hypothetical protein
LGKCELWGYWDVGVLGRNWEIGMMENWNDGEMVKWSIGKLESWKCGFGKCLTVNWSIGHW